MVSTVLLLGQFLIVLGILFLAFLFWRWPFSARDFRGVSVVGLLPFASLICVLFAGVVAVSLASAFLHRYALSAQFAFGVLIFVVASVLAFFMRRHVDSRLA